MSDTPRKTLRLPSRKDGEETPVNPRRKPIRSGGSANPRRKPEGAETEKPDPAAKRDWRKNKPGTSGAASPDRTRSEPGKGAARAGDKALAPTSPGRKTISRPRDEAKRERFPDTRNSEPAPERTNAQSGVRVSKLMAEQGLCSRREADEYIVRGWVYVDGERITELGTRADPSAKITLDQQAKATQQRQMTVLLHKPVGYVSGQPEPGFQPALVLIRPENQHRTPDTPVFHASHLKGLAPAGRLDIDSTGLLVLTQDGRIARQLIGENSKVEKEYLVRVAGQLIENGLELLNHGLELDGRALKPAKVEWLNDDQLRFLLHEGRKRQIRRMCELVGLRVTGLKRVRTGKIRLGDLPLGKWRYLRDNETF